MDLSRDSQTESSNHNVTRLLSDWSRGDKDAFEELLPVVYQELRRMARRQMGLQRRGHTLQTTALINEAYLRLANGAERSWQNRSHFFGVASCAMRHILVDYARAQKTGRRGGGVLFATLEEGLVSTERAEELVALDDALNTLANLHPRQHRVVEMRYFGGLGVEETAEALQISPETVMRDWRAAKVWLHRELGARPSEGFGT